MYPGTNGLMKMDILQKTMNILLLRESLVKQNGIEKMKWSLGFWDRLKMLNPHGLNVNRIENYKKVS